MKHPTRPCPHFRLSRMAAAPLAGLLLLATLPSRADSADAVAKATSATKAWLALVDGGRYGASWDAAAALFQAAITKANWEKTIGNARSPLGAAPSRTLKSATFTHELPGAPKGDYVVIQFNTDFEKKPGSVETVTPMLEEDGTWKVSGYFIK